MESGQTQRDGLWGITRGKGREKSSGGAQSASKRHYGSKVSGGEGGEGSNLQELSLKYAQKYSSVNERSVRGGDKNVSTSTPLVQSGYASTGVNQEGSKNRLRSGSRKGQEAGISERKGTGGNRGENSKETRDTKKIWDSQHMEAH